MFQKAICEASIGPKNEERLKACGGKLETPDFMHGTLESRNTHRLLKPSLLPQNRSKEVYYSVAVNRMLDSTNLKHLWFQTRPSLILISYYRMENNVVTSFLLSA